MKELSYPGKLALGREVAVQTVFEDGASGDDADEGVFVVDDGDEVLICGDEDEIFDARVDADGVNFAAGENFGDEVVLGLAQVHDAQALERPEKVTLGQYAAVAAVFIENRQSSIAGIFHTFHRLTQGGAGFNVGTQRLRRQEKQNVHVSGLL